MPNIFKSNKFWLATATAIAIVVNDFVPTIDPDTLTNIVYLIITAIVGLSAEEFARSKNG